MELLFDNSETTLEGQYAKYSEIAIRREVSRDGISAYYLNGTRCRRKDITGIFLGTGLGPRSYSIIEQGMISRLIEAKPEEMRVFMEEAAGISKYKERRRETSNRIKHTKENIDRLKDVLDEVEKQIKHLDRQAKTAERYGRMRDKERRTAAELLALRLRALDENASHLNSDLAEKETSLEMFVAEQRKVEAGTERARVDQTERSDAFNAVQARYYKAGAEIARLEQSIEHAHELRERQQNDLQQAIQGASEIAEHINKDQSEIAQLELSLSELVPGLQQAQETERHSLQSLERAEQALAEWQAQWDDYTLSFSDAEQIRNVESTRTEQLESRINSLAQRHKKLGDEERDGNPDEIRSKHEKLVGEEQRKRQARDEFERALHDIAEKIRKLREQDAKLTRLVDERLATLQSAEAKHASIEAIQKAALGQSDEGIQRWLESVGMSDNERVAQSLDVEEGWERAVETVLGDYLQAVCVSDVASAVENLGQLKSGNLTLLESRVDDVAVANTSTLAAKVNKAPLAIMEILQTVRIADSLESALAVRDQIGSAGSVITAEGVWISQSWLRVRRDKDPQAGVLGRGHDLRRLMTEIRELRVRSESAKNLLQDGRSRLSQLEERR